MIYREAGQFKTSYGADQAIFPILQDRSFVLALIAGRLPGRAAVRQPSTSTPDPDPVPDPVAGRDRAQHPDRLCGQVSLGTGGFMAVGAYAAYNSALRVPDAQHLIVVFLLGGADRGRGRHAVRPAVSLRIKGFYLAVATLAAQFFLDWLFARVKWFTNYAPSGSVARRRDSSVFGWPDRHAGRALSVHAWPSSWCSRWSPRTWCAAASAARGWRSATWTSPPRSSASGRCTPSSRPSPSARSSSASPAPMWGFLLPRRVGAAGLRHQPLVPAPVHGDHRRAGLASSARFLGAPSSC